MKKLVLISTVLAALSAAEAQTTNNPGVPIFGAGGTSSGLQYVFVNGLGLVASPNNFYQANAFGIVNSSGATNATGSRTAFMSDVQGAITTPTNQWGSTYITTTSLFGPTSTNRNSAVPQTTWAQFQSGSASAFYDLPPQREVMSSIQTAPWIGTITTDARQTPGGSQVYQYLTNLDQLVPMSQYFNTSGIAGVLKANGTAPNVWVDQLWYSNHLANGLLVPLQGKFSGGISNVMYQMHTNGTTATFHIYQLPIVPNQTNGDTEVDWAQNSPNTSYSWPSQNTALTANPFWFPVMTPLNTRSWIDWMYQQGMDGIFSADALYVPSFRGYDYWRASSLFDAIMYPNLGVRAEGRDRWDLAYPWVTHPIWLGFFVDQPHAASLFSECNVWTPDQSANIVGTAGGLSQGMSRLEWYYNTAFMSNQPPNSAMPFFSPQDFSTGVSPTWTLNDYTNHYSIVAITHGCAAMSWTRESNSWNTIQNVLTTNAGFLNVWLDKPRYMPIRIFDNGTNSVWVNRHSSGDFILFAENRAASATNLTIDLGQAGFIPTNNVSYDVIPVFGGQWGGGSPVTNLITTNLAANTSIFWRLRPVPAWNLVPPQRFSLQSANETLGANVASIVQGLPGYIQYNNSAEADAAIPVPNGMGFSNVLFQATYENNVANTWSNSYYTRWSSSAGLQTSETQPNFSYHVAPGGIITATWTNHWTNDNAPRQVLIANLALTNSANGVQLPLLQWRIVPQ